MHIVIRLCQTQGAPGVEKEDPAGQARQEADAGAAGQPHQREAQCDPRVREREGDPQPASAEQAVPGAGRAIECQEEIGLSVASGPAVSWSAKKK